MSLRQLVVFAAFCAVLAPGETRAEWFLNPFIGGAFGGGVAEAPKIDYGGAVGWMGSGVGVEVDVSHRPDFFKVGDVPDVLAPASFLPVEPGASGRRRGVPSQPEYYRFRSTEVRRVIW